jgi:hypothetical protein
MWQSNRMTDKRQHRVIPPIKGRLRTRVKIILSRQAGRLDLVRKYRREKMVAYSCASPGKCVGPFTGCVRALYMMDALMKPQS